MMVNICILKKMGNTVALPRRRNRYISESRSSILLEINQASKCFSTRECYAIPTFHTQGCSIPFQLVLTGIVL